MKYWANFIIVQLILFGTINLNAQQLSCNAIQLEDIICDFEELNGFTGTMPTVNSPGTQPNPLCPNGGAPHNISWVAFIAHGGEYSITVTPTGCSGSTTGQEGIQIGLYTDCTFTESVYCDPNCSTNPASFDSNVLEEGQTYYFFIDGCSGTVCDYLIEISGTYVSNQSVSGTTFIDYNSDGIQNGLEPELGNVNITLDPGNLMTLSDSKGYFSFEDITEGSYTITATVSEGDWEEEEVSIEITHTGSCENYEIGFTPQPSMIPDALVSITNSIARCDWETNFYITIQNTSSNVLDGTFEFKFDDLTSYVSSDIPNISVNGNIALANTGILEAYEVKNYIVTLKMPPVSTPLPVLDFSITVFDNNQISIAEYSYTDPLRCSYDPNDKKEHPDREGDENLTLFEEDLEYKIRFQNNGNDTAFTVRIIDELDPSIEPTSIRVVNSSHTVQTSIENGILQFLFEDIFLVDSTTNYNESQGFVTFRCNVKDGIAENTPVVNSADIIFDSNPPIITNSTLNTFVSILCTNKMTEIDIEICDGDSYNGYTESGTYTDIIPLAFDCDSIIVINLDVQGITYSAFDEQVCEGNTILLNDVEYTLFESQEISDTIYNSMGCISNVLIYDVSVIPQNQISIDTTICEGMDYFGMDATGTYTIVDVLDNGCDSTTVVDLTVIEPTLSNMDFEVCEGDQISINGTGYTFTESTEIIDTIFDTNGCISVLTTVGITVNPTEMISIDTTICEGMSYLGFTESGEYSLDSINENGCFDLYSIQLTVLPLSDPACIVGIDDLDEKTVKIYPNPVSDILFIEAKSLIEGVSIYSMSYQKVQEIALNKSTNTLELSIQDINPGLYIIAIKTERKVVYKKLIVD